MVFLLLAAPRLAEACPVCGAADDKTKGMFIFSTAFLTFLPLTIIGGVGYWVVRRVRHLDQTGPFDPSDDGLDR